jgi:hypothetical protein
VSFFALFNSNDLKTSRLQRTSRKKYSHVMIMVSVGLDNHPSVPRLFPLVPFWALDLYTKKST